ncbi:hypothetical protein E2320_017293 [Naja naja]|nr:hypothetical protein E2320_017293 [Naja naja]
MSQPHFNKCLNNFIFSLLLKVRHRWCEMIIKHKYVAGYADVDKFLKEDQAMGVYLYGELMLNEDAKQQEIAYKTFATVRDHMDASSAKVVAEMLFDKWLSSAPEEKVRCKPFLKFQTLIAPAAFVS